MFYIGVDARLRSSTSVDARLHASTDIDGRKHAWCGRTGLLACVLYRRRRASTSVDARLHASTDVDGRRHGPLALATVHQRCTHTQTDNLGLQDKLNRYRG